MKIKYKLIKISALLVFTFFISFSLATMCMETSSAQSSDPASQSTGLLTIWGKVYKSDGTPVGPEYDSTYAAVIIEHEGVTTTHTDDDGGLHDGYYKCTINPGYWSPNDKYSVIIDGSPWGDLSREKADGIKINADQEVVSSGINHWYLSGPGQINRDVITLKEKPDERTNLEPFVAIMCAIVIGLIGTTFVIGLDKQKVNVLIMDKKKYRFAGKKVGWGMLEYTCGYGNLRRPKVIGGIFGTYMNVKVDTVQKVSVNKIIRSKDGRYMWYKPKLLFHRNPAKLPSRIDSTKDMDSLWFAGGGIKLETGEDPRHAVKLYRARRFATLVLPFMMVELFMAFTSWYGLFSVYSWWSYIIRINIAIIVIGVIAQSWAYWRTAKVKRIDLPLVEEFPEDRFELEIMPMSRYKPVDKPITFVEQPSMVKTGGGGQVQPTAESGATKVTAIAQEFPVARSRYLPPARMDNLVKEPPVTKPVEVKTEAPEKQIQPTPSIQPMPKPISQPTISKQIGTTPKPVKPEVRKYPDKGGNISYG